MAPAGVAPPHKPRVRAALCGWMGAAEEGHVSDRVRDTSARRRPDGGHLWSQGVVETRTPTRLRGAARRAREGEQRC